ncbi:MAG: hypothetical protein WA751_02435 [Candidatus Dormiibacterota bacterium]
MSFQPTRDEGVETGPSQVAASVRLGPGGGTHAPFDLPPEQAMALAEISTDGILDTQFAHRLGMSSAEAARIKGTLMRRRLVHRTPPGRARTSSRLALTERGEQGLRWLEQLQTSLPTTLFDRVEPLVGPFKLVDGVSPPEETAAAKTSFFARLHKLHSETRPREPSADFGTSPAEIFPRVFFNVTLGTGLFGTAVLVGILQQTERAALVALGVGCLLALIFFLRAGAVLFRHARARAWFARRLRRLRGEHRPTWPRHRPPSGRAVD